MTIGTWLAVGGGDMSGSVCVVISTTCISDIRM